MSNISGRVIGRPRGRRGRFWAVLGIIIAAALLLHYGLTYLAFRCRPEAHIAFVVQKLYFTNQNALTSGKSKIPFLPANFRWDKYDLMAADLAGDKVWIAKPMTGTPANYMPYPLSRHFSTNTYLQMKKDGFVWNGKLAVSGPTGAGVPLPDIRFVDLGSGAIGTKQPVLGEWCSLEWLTLWCAGADTLPFLGVRDSDHQVMRWDESSFAWRNLGGFDIDKFAVYGQIAIPIISGDVVYTFSNYCPPDNQHLTGVRLRGFDLETDKVFCSYILCDKDSSGGKVFDFYRDGNEAQKDGYKPTYMLDWISVQSIKQELLSAV